jgi:hypothetical protein
VSEELLISAKQLATQDVAQPERPTLSSESVNLIPEILDVFSSSFFSLPFCTLTYMLGCWWSRFLAEE